MRAGESVYVCVRKGVLRLFKPLALHRLHRRVLPVQDVHTAQHSPQNSSKMSDANPVMKDLENFNTKKLKKTATEERNTLPTQEDIQQEKKEQQQQQQK